MYGFQALWTAAKYQAPVTILLCNNAEYRILKDGAASFELPQAAAGNFVGMELNGPAIDFVGLAKSLGVEAVRVDSVEGLRTELLSALDAASPRLIEARVGE